MGIILQFVGHPPCRYGIWFLSCCYHLASAMSLCSFFFVLGCGISFLVGFRVPFDGGWTTSLILVPLRNSFQEKMSACPSILPSWTRSLNLFSSLFFTPLCVSCLRIHFLSLPYFLFLSFFFLYIFFKIFLLQYVSFLEIYNMFIQKLSICIS